MGSIGAAELIVVAIIFLLVLGLPLVAVVIAMRAGRRMPPGQVAGLWPCRACGKPISPRAAACPQCGEPRAGNLG
jgi:hypothetical protein